MNGVPDTKPKRSAIVTFVMVDEPGVMALESQDFFFLVSSLTGFPSAVPKRHYGCTKAFASTLTFEHSDSFLALFLFLFCFL
jgi:hypothetical protein